MFIFFLIIKPFSLAKIHTWKFLYFYVLTYWLFDLYVYNKNQGRGKEKNPPPNQINQLSKLCQIKYLENEEHISLFKVQLLTDKLESKRIISKLRWININNRLIISNGRNNYERTKEEEKSI